MKQAVQKIGEFEKSKFVKSGFYHKRLIKQIKRTRKKGLNNWGIRKI